jgi:hypothetical protein
MKVGAHLVGLRGRERRTIVHAAIARIGAALEPPAHPRAAALVRLDESKQPPVDAVENLVARARVRPRLGVLRRAVVSRLLFHDRLSHRLHSPGSGWFADTASRFRAAKRRRIARPLFPPKPPRGPGGTRPPSKREAERRKAPLLGPHLRPPSPSRAPARLRRARPKRRTRRLSALHRGDFGPRDRASGAERRAHHPPYRGAFAPLARPSSSPSVGGPP